SNDVSKNSDKDNQMEIIRKSEQPREDTLDQIQKGTGFNESCDDFTCSHFECISYGGCHEFLCQLYENHDDSDQDDDGEDCDTLWVR
ncbi:MAG: hypothetical protein LIP08_00065, partial [Bacteroides sp.]|nr:hypothetical protein [Bacteroides sp.]